MISQVGFDLDSNDGCYRNFLCAHSAWGVPDVSHVVSNAGYFFFGLLFMAGSEFRQVFFIFLIFSPTPSLSP